MKLFSQINRKAIFVCLVVRMILFLELMTTNDIIMLGIGTNIAAGLGSWIFSLMENRIGSKNANAFLSLIASDYIQDRVNNNVAGSGYSLEGPFVGNGSFKRRDRPTWLCSKKSSN